MPSDENPQINQPNSAGKKSSSCSNHNHSILLYLYNNNNNNYNYNPSKQRYQLKLQQMTSTMQQNTKTIPITKPHNYHYHHYKHRHHCHQNNYNYKHTSYIDHSKCRLYNQTPNIFVRMMIFSILLYLYLTIPVTAITEPLLNETKTCSGIHVRNNLESFEQLRGCSIINGPLTIALISNHTKAYEPRDYDNITFPELREITGFLVFFRVQGLTTLAKLFPNLAVIRGKQVVSQYSFIIYEMMHLQEINLPKLVDILAGDIRIDSNPNLCYASTVNWHRIAKKPYDGHYIENNNLRCSTCPDFCVQWPSESGPTSDERIFNDVKRLGTEQNKFCWSSTVCHQPCPSGCETCDSKGVCCSSQCAGGCYVGNQSNRCISCRSVTQKDKCKEQCDPEYYRYEDLCLTEAGCISTPDISLLQENECLEDRDNNATERNELYRLKPYRERPDAPGTCLSLCPDYYEEDLNNRNKCKRCDKGKCRKVCTPTGKSSRTFLVNDIISLKKLTGCNVIDGSLEISIQGGKNVLSELEKALQNLEEVYGYLKITRTNSLLTLGFLKNLRLIRGDQLDRSLYSLIIINNPNLQELFMFNNTINSTTRLLDIARGTISVHLNPKLCIHRVNNLKTYAHVESWDEKDVSKHTNGDKEACNVEKLDVAIEKISADVTLIRIENFAKRMDDPRSLLSYLISYREVASGNITIFEGRDGCSNDLWKTREEPMQNNYDADNKMVFINVRPATRYALYVKTFTILSQDTGAMSDIIYFVTAPSTPTMPRLTGKPTSHDSAKIKWLPPTKPNGYIDRYVLTITKLKEMLDEPMDICTVIKQQDKIPKKLAPSESPLMIDSHINSNNSSSELSSPSNCDSKTTQTVQTKDTTMQEKTINFQDNIIENIYLKQRFCKPNNSTKPIRKRRAISYQPNPPNVETIAENNRIAPTNQLPAVGKKSSVLGNSNQTSNHKVVNPELKFSSSSDVMVFNITADDKPFYSYTIRGLKHYSQYSFEVVACHKPVSGVKFPKEYSPCSLQALTYVRTDALEDNDKIDASNVKFYPANETSESNFITWNKPADPNGPIFAYLIDMTAKAESPKITITECINVSTFENNGGYNFNIQPGRYSLVINAITLHSLIGSRPINDPLIEFDIPSDSIASPFTISIVLIFCLAFLITVIYTSCYFHKQKTAANGLLYASVNPDYIQYEADEWEVDKNNLVVGTSIGTGSFGQVFKGELVTEKGRIECAIKTVPTTATAKHRMDFLREASTMKQFDTHHVVKLLGVVSVSTPVYVIMELMSNGDLKSYLRRERNKYEQEKNCLVEGIHTMAAQIADGMAYLASRKYVHRDLAARNCLVSADKTVKIGDFGLTRDVFQSEYYRRNTEARLPVRWMAPEALSDNIYTTASDVWSYGIVLWEIVTFSAYPYQGLSNDEVVKRVTAGHTLSRPDNCTDSLFKIMQKCWRKNSAERPSFVDLIETLMSEAETKLAPESYYRKQKTEPNSIAQGSPDESSNHTTGTESYPLLSWPSNRAPGVFLNLEQPQE